MFPTCVRYRRGAGFRAEQLESRDCPAVVFDNDYTQDVNGFFTPARRALLEFAEQQLMPSLQDNLAAVIPDPANGNKVSYEFENTATRQNEVISDLAVPANVIRVYVWGIPQANYPTPGILATCGPAGYSYQGTTAWIDTVIARGQTGRLATPATDTSVSVIRMDVNEDAKFYENTARPPAGAAPDLVSVFEHELLHPLGFLGKWNPATERWLNADGQFVGPHVTALAGGPVSMVVPGQSGAAPSVGDHWAPGTTVNWGPALMDPYIKNGRLTALDAALLADVGWESGVPPPPPETTANDGDPVGPGDPSPDQDGPDSGGFAVGQDVGGSTAQLTNADGTPEFTVTPFPNFTGGVRTAAADFNGDGIPDLVVGTGPGVPTRVRVLDGITRAELFSVQPFEPGFTGGVYVSAADINGDDRAELFVSPDQGGGPRVQVYDGKTFAKVADFYGIDDPAFRGGARTTVGDLNGDGQPDLVVAAGFGGGPRVSVWANADVLAGDIPNAHPLLNQFVFEPTLRNGVFVAAGDVNGDGVADLIAGGGPGGGPRVLVLSGQGLTDGRQVTLGNFFAGDPAARGGARVATKDLDDDGRSDILVGNGQGSGARVTAYDGVTVTPSGGAPQTLLAFDFSPGFNGGEFVG